MNKYNLINTTLTFQAIRSKLTGNIIWSAIVNELNQNITLDSKDFKEDIFKEFKHLFVTFYNSDYVIPLEEIFYEDKYKDLVEVISGEINLISPLSIENQIERAILIHDDKYTNSLNIRVGDVLNHYDDGKIRESRRSRVIITNVVEYDKVEKHIKKQYKKMLKDEFNREFYIYPTSHFIFAESISNPSDKYIYVESTRGWYSFNAGFLNNGLLDIYELANPF